MGYTPNYSHLVGIMISKTIGCRVHYFQTNPSWGGILETGKDMTQLSTLAEQNIHSSGWAVWKARLGGSQVWKLGLRSFGTLMALQLQNTDTLQLGQFLSARKCQWFSDFFFYNHDLNPTESKEIQLKIKKQAMPTTFQGILRIATLPSR